MKRDSFAWPIDLQESARRNNFTEWILHENNTAHNRQFNTFLDLGALGDHYGLDKDLNTDVSNCVNINGTKYLSFWRKHGDLLEVDLKSGLLDTISDNFLFVGITEKMDSSVVMFSEIAETRLNLKRMLKLSKSKNSKKIRHESKKSNVTYFQRRLIRERNRLDYFLYEKMMTRFDDSVKFYTPHLKL